ncbi:MAG TPA: hypothetical protein P5317_10785 [Myxococcota bacterium]|nr:hypothetical protein [Myxococcota bacterium]HRR74845.1 hypothetical protein [Myxococcota bacterium]HRV18479.1 hypothetical protein [Myxococcota bacterium]
MDVISILTECLIYGVKFSVTDTSDLVANKELSAIPAQLQAEIKAQEADIAWVLEFDRPSLPFSLWKQGFPDYESAEKYAKHIYFCASTIATDNERQCFAVVEYGFRHSQANIERMRRAVPYKSK